MGWYLLEIYNRRGAGNLTKMSEMGFFNSANIWEELVKWLEQLNRWLYVEILS